MELAADLLKILLPSSLLLYGVFLIVKTFLNKEFEKKQVEIKFDNNKIVLPIRLQAYERMCLFLERISLNNLIIRVNDPSYSAGQFHQILLAEIRNEYNHNLSQQVYMSNEAWNLIKKAMEDTTGIINTSSEQVSSEAKGIELAKKIFENHLNRGTDSITIALLFVKNEVQSIF